VKTVGRHVADGDTCKRCGLPVSDCMQHAAGGCNDIRHGRGHPGPMRVAYCLCGAEGVRSDKWDAYYCPVAYAWLESRCSDPACTLCPLRPETAK
jgi:hypothetical protein